MKIFFKDCETEDMYLELPRDDPKFKSLLYIPWQSSNDHFAFYVTVNKLMPNARIFFRPADNGNGLKLLLVDKTINFGIENNYF